MRLEIPSWRHKRAIERPQIDEGHDHDYWSFLSDSAPALLSYLDAECHYRFCNRAYSDWFGLTREEIIGKSMQEVLGDDAWRTLQPHVNEVLAGHLTQFETEAKYKSGGTRWIRVSYTPDLDDHGLVRGFGVLVTDISDSRRADEALRQSEQFSRTIIESSGDCTKIVSLDGTLLWMSEAGQKLLCLDHIESFLGTSWLDFWHGEDRVNARKALEGAARGRSETFVGLFAVGHEPRWWEVVVSPIIDTSGKPEKLLVISRDVTERKRTDEALREREALLRLFIQHAPAGIAMFDREMRYLAVSDSWKRDYRLTGNILGRSHYEVFPEIPERWKEVHRRVLAGEVLSAEEDAFRRADGSTQWVKWEARPWYLANGQIGGILVAAEEVTARVRAKNALQESEARLRTLAAETEQQRRRYHTILSNLPDLIYVFGLDHRFIYANEAMLKVWGKTESEAIGKNCLELGYEPWQATRHDHELDQVIATKKPLRNVVPFNSPQGPRIYDYIFAPVLGANGDVEAIAGATRDITELKRSEEVLRKSEALLQKAMSIKTAGVLFFDLNGRMTDANETFERMSGYTREELLHSVHWKMLTRPEYLGVTERTAENLAARGETPPYEKQMIRKDGSYWWGLFAPTRLSGTGRESQCMEFIIDITERKQAEGALRESERRFRSFVEATAHLIWRTNAQGEAERPDPSWLAFTGQTEAEAHGLGWLNAIHPDDRSKVAVAWQAALAAQGTYEVEYRLKSRSGEWRHVLARGVPVFEGGRVAEYIGTCMDVTDRWFAEERFQQLAENIPQLAWMTNAEGWIVWFNKRWYEYTGTTLEQMQGWGRAVHHPDHAERVLASWRQALKTGEPWEETFPLRGKDGNYRWFLSGAFPIRDANGRIVRWFGTNTDVTELRDTQQALEKAQEKLQFHATNLERIVAKRTAALRESNEQMETFTYTIAHDLRAPLRGQQSFAHALLDEHAAALGETGREYAERIIQSAARMDNLINDLLAYSRLSRTEMRVEEIDLRKVVLEIGDELSFQIRDARAKVQVGPFDFIVRGHRATLRTSIQNLLANALKFTKPGVPPEIRIYAEERGKYIRLWVEDNGIGIAPEHHQQIFGLFHLLHRIGQYPGTGVGLAIVQKGIERMGGRVGVESREGAGSRFWIELERPG